MSRKKERFEEDEREKLKRSRRARRARVLPRSGGGAHEDKKSKMIEKDLEEEAQEQIDNWDEYYYDED